MTGFLETVLSAGLFCTSFSQLDSPSLSVPRSKIKALYIDSIHKSRFFVVAHVVRPCAETFPAYVEGEPGPTQPRVTWLNWCQRDRNILRLSFLGRMCSQDDETGAFWKGEARPFFPLLRSVHLADGENPSLTPTSAPSTASVGMF